MGWNENIMQGGGVASGTELRTTALAVQCVQLFRHFAL